MVLCVHPTSMQCLFPRSVVFAYACITTTMTHTHTQTHMYTYMHTADLESELIACIKQFTDFQVGI
jgi:hypothetical protein